MYEYLEDLNSEEITIDDVPVIVNIDDVDYGNEFDEMFRRMQIDRLHGRTGFVYDRPMTYIDAPVAYTYKDHKGRDEEQIGTLPINVVGRIYIFPKGIQILT